METFAPPKPFVDHPRFQRERELVLADIVPENIDEPVRGLIAAFADLPFCFTLQCCYGHFLYADESDSENLNPLPTHDVGPVEYRIAYLAFCLENSRDGRRLFSGLEKIPAIDPEFIQFGSPDWFWHRYSNSFALQVEPRRFMNSDVAIIGHQEALLVEKTRDRFFDGLAKLIRSTGLKVP